MSLNVLDPDTKISIEGQRRKLERPKETQANTYHCPRTAVKNGEKILHPAKVNFHLYTISQRRLTNAKEGSSIK